MHIDIRPATLADFESFYGRGPENTSRALAVFKDGELAAIAGITIAKTYIEAFSDISPGLIVPRRTIWRYAMELKRYIAALNLPVIAVADPEKPMAGKFLESLGFTYAGEFNNEKVYRLNPWKQQP